MAKTQTKAFNETRSVPMPDGADIKRVAVDIEFPATAPAVNDLIEILKLPIGVRVDDWTLVFPDIDSNGSPALAFSLGVENAGGTDLGTEVWATGLTAGQSTAIVRNTTSIASQGDTTAIRAIALKVTTIAGTYAGAGKVGRLILDLAA